MQHLGKLAQLAFASMANPEILKGREYNNNNNDKATEAMAEQVSRVDIRKQ